MTEIKSLKLEIVRPGLRHGQLLSKITNYVALCDGAAADTVQVPFDHYELRADIRALRYYITGSDGRQPVPNPIRADAVQRLSNRVEKIISQMESFKSRVAEESTEGSLTHVRLILGGSELSLIPFELATAPAGWRAAGHKLMLQTRSPVVITREIRGSGSIPLKWNQRPRILVCSAKPDGFQPPPLLAHVTAILRALRPWIDGGMEKGRYLRPSDVITVLENASLEAIQQEMASKDYTHVHFICHGCELPESGGRFGIALASPGAPGRLTPASAEQLVYALRGNPEKGHVPTMVVLACCDSANQNTVESPGSSIADHLHREGIPWVLASQLPLTYGGSDILANQWYQGLFHGQDPRWVLYDLRQDLNRHQDSHDWASMVAYASFPHDFEQQVDHFRIAQMMRFINSAFARVALCLTKTTKQVGEEEQEFNKIDQCLKEWEFMLTNRTTRSDAEWSQFHGMRGTVAKQKAECLPEYERMKAIDLLRTAADCYLEAAKAQIQNHWVVVQYLALSKLLGLDEEQAGWFETASLSALLDVETSLSPSAPGDSRTSRGRVWGLASLLELAILSKDGTAGGKSAEEWAREFKKHVRPDSFEFFSTWRQLRRYRSVWQKLFGDRKNYKRDFDRPAQKALAVIPKMKEQEKIARALHEIYRKNQQGRKGPDDPAMQPWDRLSENLTRSNRGQADFIRPALHTLGYDYGPHGDGEPHELTAEEIEILAEKEHERWVLERERDGWTQGERDPVRKITPHLVPWSKLTEEIKEYDRETVRAWPEALSIAGLQIFRTNPAGGGNTKAS